MAGASREPNWLGKGYGEIMMRLAFQLCIADSLVTAIVIDPRASNVRAHRFCRRLGFEPVCHRRFGDDDCLVHELTREDWHTHFEDDAAVRLAGPVPVKETIRTDPG
jgi:RimJ/RimL family protein N-acetyltransferase